MSKFLDLEGLGYYTQCFKPGLAEVIDEGAKNLLDCSINALKQRLKTGTWDNNVYTLPTGDVTLTVSSDNTITVSATNVTTNRTITIGYVEINMGELYFSCTPNEEGVGTKFRSGVNYVGYDNGEGINVPNLTTRRAIQLEIVGSSASPTTISNIVYKPMLCTKAAWNISHAYQPYTLSNAELTDFIPKSMSIENYQFSAASVWEYSGLFFTIPNGQAYICTASMNWISGQPESIAICDSSNPTNVTAEHIIAIATYEGTELCCTGQKSGLAGVGGRTWYVMVKNKSASGKSTIRLTAQRAQ